MACIIVFAYQKIKNMNNQPKSKNKISAPLGILLILLSALLAGVLVWQGWLVPEYSTPPIITPKPEKAEFAECSGHYTVSCYDKDYSEVIKGNIPCFDENDCSLENMNYYCSPGRPNILKCAGAKYYCGVEGFCKGCDCPFPF